jgi:hypothetical protein
MIAARHCCQTDTPPVWITLCNAFCGASPLPQYKEWRRQMAGSATRFHVSTAPGARFGCAHSARRSSRRFVLLTVVSLDGVGRLSIYSSGLGRTHSPADRSTDGRSRGEGDFRQLIKDATLRIGQVVRLAVASVEPVEDTNVAPRIRPISTGIGRAQSPTPL